MGCNRANSQQSSRLFTKGATFLPVGWKLGVKKHLQNLCSSFSQTSWCQKGGIWPTLNGKPHFALCCVDSCTFEIQPSLRSSKESLEKPGNHQFVARNSVQLPQIHEIGTKKSRQLTTSKGKNFASSWVWPWLWVSTDMVTLPHMRHSCAKLRGSYPHSIWDNYTRSKNSPHTVTGVNKKLQRSNDRKSTFYI